MASFRFSATDADGRRVEGSIEADDHSTALRLLREGGYKNGQVNRETPVAAPSQPKPRPVVPKVAPAPVVVRPVTPVAVAAPQPTPPSTAKDKTKGSDKDRHLLFSQLAQQLNAGISPAAAFANIGRSTRTKFREAFLEIGRANEQGVPPSTVMEHYPRLFPPQVVGLSRAGEEGGFLPEAYSQISQQAQDTHKFRKFHWFIGPSILRFVVLVPGAVLGARAMLTWWKLMDATGGTGDTWGLGMQAFAEELKWPVGPLTALAYFILLLIWIWWKSDMMKRARHAAGLRIPIYGPRARNECVNIFCWTLSRLSESGVSPQRSWEVAISAVPNLEMRERLAKAGRLMRDGTKLSQVVFESKLFPEDYAPVISTGEMVGDLPGSLKRLADVSRSDFETQTTKAQAQSISFGCTFGLVTSGVACIILAYMWYNQLPKTMLEGFE